MEIKGVSVYTQAVAPSVKPQAPPEPGTQAAKETPRVQPPVSGGGPAARPRVQARDLLSEDERRYLESLFPGATEEASGDAYAGQGRLGAVPTGSIVDRKG